MDRFVIRGGNALRGKVRINGAKNSVLPLVAASLITEGKTIIRNCPKIRDVLVMAEIVEALGGKFSFEGDSLAIDTSGVNKWILPEKYTGEIRASVFMTGALITRFKLAETTCPGGCNIGCRPIDIHIDAFKALGIITKEGRKITFDGKNSQSGKIILRYPSVGATENVMMAAVRLKGLTTIENCAKEPEIVDLQNYLNAAGFGVKGAGSDRIVIEGKDGYKGKEIEFTPSKDRIEAGTFLLAGLATGGEIEFEGLEKRENLSVYKIIARNACKIYEKNGKIYYVKFRQTGKGLGKVTAKPFPGFPTDLQPQLVAAASVMDGLTVAEDTVFPKRFSYCEELKKMGANLRVAENLCVVEGGRLKGAIVSAGDLRGGAALCIAALSAEGVTTVLNVNHIDRGYEDFEKKLRLLGASVERITY